MDRVLQNLILQSDEALISIAKKELILSNFDLLTIEQKMNLLAVLDRSGLYERTILKLDVNTANLKQKDE